MLKITGVDIGSIAEELGFEVGDAILAVNGEEMNDLMDFAYAEGQDVLDITVLTKDGEEIVVEMAKDPDDVLGLAFAEDQIEPMLCKNNCSFCFVAQLPKGMRKSLYVKDDDWRLSCICGNYVTLTNVTDREFERILRLGVSPLYVSVHAYTTEIRRKILKNPMTDVLFERLVRLSDAGIKLHTQIVMAKGVNDGEELRLTLAKLREIDGVQSVAVVPVGLTGHRQGLEEVVPVDKASASDAIDACLAMGLKDGQQFAYCSDEMYLRAERDIPPYEFYGNFCQIENGVGMIASFNREFSEALAVAPTSGTGKFRVITGVSARDTIARACENICARIQGIAVEVLVVENDFFGKSITVTGLITGRDMARAMGDGKDEFTYVVPSVTMREGETVFLDDMTLDELKLKTSKDIIVADSARGSSLVEAIVSHIGGNNG